MKKIESLYDFLNLSTGEFNISGTIVDEKNSDIIKEVNGHAIYSRQNENTLVASIGLSGLSEQLTRVAVFLAHDPVLNQIQTASYANTMTGLSVYVGQIEQGKMQYMSVDTISSQKSRVVKEFTDENTYIVTGYNISYDETAKKTFEFKGTKVIYPTK